MKINNIVKEIFEDIVNIRRTLSHPETGMNLKYTSDLISNELDKYNIKYIRFDDSGIVVDIIGEKDCSNKIVMLRADMDALDIIEETDLEFASKIYGKMHACGHDLHTAILIGTARILNNIKDDFSGTIRLLFQAGEEIGEGAKFLIKIDVLKDVNIGFGLHRLFKYS